MAELDFEDLVPKKQAADFDFEDLVPKTSGTMDFLKTLPGAAVRGFAGVLSAAGKSAAPQSGMTPEQIEAMPGPQETTQALEKNVTGPLYQPQTPFAQNYGEAIGETFGNPLSYIGPGGLAAKGAAALGSAIGGEAAGQATKGSAFEIPARFLGGMAGGHAVLSPPKVGAPLKPIAADRQALIDTLKGEGVTSLTAGQQRGSKGLRYLESITADSPLSGTGAEEINEASKKQFTSAVLRRMGENAEAATPDVIERARQRIGDKMDEVAKKLPVTFSEDFGNKLAGIEQDLTNEGLAPEQVNRIVKNIENVRNAFITKAPATNISPPKAGTVRFYHGGDNPGSGGGRWVSQNKDYAANYRPGQQLNYVDIPETWLSKNANKSFDDTGTSQKSGYVNFEAPEQFAKKMKPVQEGLDRTIAEMRANQGTPPPSNLQQAMQQGVAGLNAAAAGSGTAKGVMPGSAYQMLTRKNTPLDRLTNSQNPDERFYGGRIRDALDEAMWKSANARGTREGTGRRQAAKDLLEARRQWRTMVMASKAVAGGGEDAAKGYISPAQLRMQLAGSPQDKLLYARGGGMKDLGDLSRAGNAIMTPLPNSGTSQREQAREMFNLATTLKGSEPGAAAGGAIGGIFGGIPGALMGAAAGPFATGAAGRVLHSQPVQKYLTNQLPGQQWISENRPGASPAWLSLVNVLRGHDQKEER